MKADDKIGVYPTTVVKSTEVTVYRVMIGECQIKFESESLDDAQIFADGLRARQLANERKAADQPAPTPVPQPEAQEDDPVTCEGCDKPATMSDGEGNPLCADCLALAIEEAKTQPASADPKGDVARSIGSTDLIEQMPIRLAYFGCGRNIDTLPRKNAQLCRDTAVFYVKETFARIRETVAIVAPDDAPFTRRVLDETARRLGIKP